VRAFPLPKAGTRAKHARQLSSTDLQKMKKGFRALRVVARSTRKLRVQTSCSVMLCVFRQEARRLIAFINQSSSEKTKRHFK
jgi:hypothetical protein